MTTDSGSGPGRDRIPGPTGGGAGGGGGVPAVLRVLIVEDDTFVGLGLRAQVEQLGHSVVGQAADAPQALDLYLRHQPDVVLMDVRLDGGPDRVDGVDLAGKLMALRRCPMVVVTAYSDQPLIERAGKAGVFGYLIKPVRTEALAAQLEVAVRRFAEHDRLARENQQLAQTLENRKVIERAKGIFMKRLNLDEPEAHRRLQLESQKRRVGLVELAKKIIESEDLLGGGGGGGGAA